MNPDRLAAEGSTRRTRCHDRPNDLGSNSAKLLDCISDTRSGRDGRFNDDDSAFAQASQINGIRVLRDRWRLEYDEIELAANAGDKPAEHFTLEEARWLVNNGAG